MATREASGELLGRGPAGRHMGVLNTRTVRFISFVVVTIGLFATSLLCILAIWNYASNDTAWRAISTLGVVTGTMVAFTILNETFGSKIDL